jgi:hypothetical protein
MPESTLSAVDFLDVEREKLHKVAEGVTARYAGKKETDNPYVGNLDEELLWLSGWEEANEELTLLNLAAVSVDLLEAIEPQGNGLYKISDPLFNIFQKAISDARLYVD